MKPIFAAALGLTLVGAAAAAHAPKMEVSSNGSRAAAKAPADYFTGGVIVEPLIAAEDSMPSTGGLVTFEPGARSAWHTHPAGQILIVTSGTGWVQEEGGDGAADRTDAQKLPQV